jgi:hypothetical protein
MREGVKGKLSNWADAFNERKSTFYPLEIFKAEFQRTKNLKNVQNSAIIYIESEREM